MEPKIVIEDIPLAPAQAMTLRVAMESFAMSLREDGLGDDEHGKAMVRLYLERIDEIRSIFM
jgi:hypothetical protein